MAVFRMSFSLDFPLIIPPMVTGSASDGVSTEWSITIRYTDPGGATSTGKGIVKLIRTPEVLRPTLSEQPKDFYAGVWSMATWVQMLNNAITDAFAAANTASGGALAAYNAPFISNNSGKLSFTANPFSLWEQSQRGTEGLDLFFSYEMENAISGFPLADFDLPFEIPLNPDGTSGWRLIVVSDGFNYLPQPATGSESLTPAAPASTTIIIPQEWATKTMPALSRVELQSTISATPEAVPGLGGSSRAIILTDFAPDTADVAEGSMQQMYTYNASFGDARWIEMQAGGPLSSFDLSVWTVDWMGIRRPLYLYTEDAINVKLCFARKDMVKMQ